MEKVYIDENYTERLVKANKALLKAYDSIDFNSNDWDQQVERLSKLHKEIANDVNNVNNAILEAEKLRIEEEKNKSDTENELDRLALEEASHKREHEDTIIRTVVEGLKITAAVCIAAISGAVGVWEFKESLKKEETGAYLTTTEKTVVSEELRKQPKSVFNLFRFW